MSIVLFDEEGEGFQYFALEKDYDAEALVEGVIYPQKGSDFERVVETGCPVIHDNVESSSWVGKKMLEEGIRSSLIFPLEYKGKIIGTMNFGSRKANHFSEDQFNLLRQIAPGLAIAIQNTLLFEETKKRLEELTILYEIAKISTSASLNMDQMLAKIVDNLTNLFKFEYLGIFLIEENTKRLIPHISYKSHHHPIEQIGGLGLCLGKGITGWVAEKGEPLRVNDVREDARYVCGNENISSEMCVPLKVGQKVIGVIDTQSKDLNAFCEDDLRLLNIAAGQIAAIIENVRLYEEIKQSEEKYRTVVEGVHDGVAMLGTDFKFRYVNNRLSEILGYSKEELTGMDFRNILGEEKQQFVVDQYLKWVREEENTPFLEFDVVRKDGEIRYIEIRNREMRDSKGNLGFVVLMRDITERLQAEEALRKSEETARRLAQENAAMAEIGRIIGSTLDINDVYERFAEKVRELIPLDRITIHIFNPTDDTVRNAYVTGLNVPHHLKGGVIPLAGTSAEKSIRTRTNMLIQIEDLKKVTDRFPELLPNFQAGIRSLMAIPLISKDEVIGVLHLQSTQPNVYSEKDLRLAERVGNQIAGAIANAQLYSKRKQAEEALKKNQEELIKKNREIDESRRNLQLALEELERAYKELKASQAKVLQQEKMASIGQLAAGVAHEINNPMAFVSSNLGTLDKYVHRLTEFIQTQSEVIASLQATEAIEGLNRKQKELKLDYIMEDIKGVISESLDGSERVQKIVQGLKSFARVDEAEYKYADMNECIESTLNIVWNELKYKATLKKDYGNLSLTKCYPQQMNQVFMNLLINAVHAIEKQGEIAIKTREEDGKILIAISDTGRGIPKEQLSKIFEPFFTTKEVGKGTGLGLSITYEIVQKHNGEITVESEVGKGTTFTVRIPIT
jgi:PAS domain S-box-containing protein